VSEREDLVAPEWGCPNCGERLSYLVLLDEEAHVIECETCGTVYLEPGVDPAQAFMADDEVREVQEAIVAIGAELRDLPLDRFKRLLGALDSVAFLAERPTDWLRTSESRLQWMGLTERLLAFQSVFNQYVLDAEAEESLRRAEQPGDKEETGAEP
jgi:hypothetical protein